MKKKLCLIFIFIILLGIAFGSYNMVKFLKVKTAEKEYLAELQDSKNTKGTDKKSTMESGDSVSENSGDYVDSGSMNTSSIKESLTSKNQNYYERIRYSSAEEFIASYSYLISELPIDTLEVERVVSPEIGGMLYFYSIGDVTVITYEDGSIYEIKIKGELLKDRIEVNTDEEGVHISESSNSTIITFS